jgi:D-serine deaminase-like pyridoxal phosphate-dependent protein
MSTAPDPVADLSARHRLARRLDAAVQALPDPATPLVVVDLDAFDANADDLAARAGGTPVRLASKSVRVPALLSRAPEHQGFGGVLAYSLREALWLAEQDVSDDIVLGYPSVDRVALRRLAADASLRSRVTLMIDDVAQLDVLDACRPGSEPVKVALDVDAGLWLGRGRRGGGLQVGPKRSPLRDPAGAVALAREALDRGLVVDGVMTYEGQVAGVPDQVPDQRARSLAVRWLKAATLPQLAERRASVAAALAELVELRFWNGGGSGSVETTAADPVVTEVAAGSGLLVPALFDHYRSFRPRPAAYFGVPVVRRPSPAVVTVAGGGFVASGPASADRLPVPWAPPGLALTGLEGAGEVQTPLTGPTAARLAIGDRVWFRHAKAGELAEHTNVVHLLAGDRVVETVPTYRGLGQAW